MNFRVVCATFILALSGCEQHAQNAPATGMSDTPPSDNASDGVFSPPPMIPAPVNGRYQGVQGGVSNVIFIIDTKTGSARWCHPGAPNGAVICGDESLPF